MPEDLFQQNPKWGLSHSIAPMTPANPQGSANYLPKEAAVTRLVQNKKKSYARIGVLIGGIAVAAILAVIIGVVYRKNKVAKKKKMEEQERLKDEGRSISKQKKDEVSHKTAPSVAPQRQQQQQDRLPQRAPQQKRASRQQQEEEPQEEEPQEYESEPDIEQLPNALEVAATMQQEERKAEKKKTPAPRDVPMPQTPGASTSVSEYSSCDDMEGEPEAEMEGEDETSGDSIMDAMRKIQEDADNATPQTEEEETSD